MEKKYESKKMNYTFEVKSRGEKRDVYLILGNGDRRKVFVMVGKKAGYLLQHVTNRELGALIDVVGMEYVHNICNVIFEFLVKRLHPYAKYHLTAFVVDSPTQYFKFYKGLNGYVESRLFERLG